VVQKQIQHAQTIKDVHKESVTNLKLLMGPKATTPKPRKQVSEDSELETDDDQAEETKETKKTKPKPARSATVANIEEAAHIPVTKVEAPPSEALEIDYSNASMPSGDVKDWNINDVQKWLMYISTRRPKSMGKDKPIIDFFQLYYSMFYARQVNGAKLIEQTSNTLANDLLIKNAHRSTLLAFIDELRIDKKKLRKKIKLLSLLSTKIRELEK